MPTLIDTLKQVVKALQTLPGCNPVSVGGSVRDAIIACGPEISMERFNHFFERVGKDFDLELFGPVTAHDVKLVLAKHGIEIELVGKSFPVYKVKGWNIDISFPRRETKTGPKHTDFSVMVEPRMTFRDAAERRDFTCNAIGYDWNSSVFLDPYNGVLAIKQKLLHPVSEKFKEDALRVLRAFKFIGRLGFQPTIVTQQYSMQVVHELRGYAYERLLPEWIDFLLNSKPENIRAAFEFLHNSNTDLIVFPEIYNIHGIVQHPTHHPEGSVDKHTIHCLEYYAKVVRGTLANDEEKLIIGIAVLAHDLGKATHTTQSDPKDPKSIKAIGHEDSPVVRKFLERLFAPTDDRVNQIEQLVKAHMRPMDLAKHESGLPAIRRLNLAVNGRIDRLMKLVECDQGGRPPKPVNLAGIEWVLNKTKELNMDNVSVIKPIILGRHIMEHLRLKPGIVIGVIQKAMFEDQLDGKFIDEASGVDYLINRYRA